MQPGRTWSSGTTRNWRRKLDETYAFMAAIQHSRSTKDVGDALLSFAGKFGTTNILAGIIPPRSASRREQLSHVLLDRWPAEWTNRYFSMGYLYRDPTIRLVAQGSQPFAWRDLGNLGELWPGDRRVMEEAAEFGLREGLTFSFLTVERQRVGLSIAGERLELPPGEQDAFLLVAAYAFGKAVILAEGTEQRQTVNLSPRQHEVLQWASLGLPVEAIADRLGISSHTADSHLRAVRERLGVQNTVHAVAEAFRLGLIA
ncbi:MAG: LuxR family transcriptional regulator [Mesorhizobium sp.]|uniref:helix-turn-helix transcriptional regulator n=1 Tax=Mesorhizobium sp. M2A.F.Ca.ET.067.02.1.1 TaxID=2496749 RepID=UPI000FD4562B|nr:LuxR family transcriptional regulator [Mesorhizobium sp. M2A.F.Ca.ET.067.02.1.1]RUW80710.1 LuxR family transcriptional regulator [Mesorhizobium sp. M2A.F.Ca.ET.067.02.1.1]TIU57979.1 MAG: LuxR family transcriptional regulator [Mesorhizobium sp.]TIW88460.1 MAG: LuxR family transcriptional regulator [Mesorhizobium sp.]